MNKFLIFFIISSVVFILNIIVLCLSPIINNVNIKTYGWNFSSWRTLNCKFFEDREDFDNILIDDLYSVKKEKNLCRRKKAMHDLEYATLIINLFIGFLCSNLSMFQYFKCGKKIPKILGLVGLISGCVGFILTIVYVSFNGYILTNDVAYDGRIFKIFSNGAKYKYISGKYITAYEDNYDEDGEYIKYKDLGDKRYNYNSEYYKYYLNSPNDCKEDSFINKNNYISGCNYIFSKPILNMENKNLYDRWITSLVFDVFILAGNFGIFILGILILVGNKGENELENTIN